MICPHCKRSIEIKIIPGPEEILLVLANQRKPVSQRWLARRFDMSRRTLRDILRKLEEKGKIVITLDGVVAK